MSIIFKTDEARITTLSSFTSQAAAPGNFNGVMPEFGRARDVQYISGIKRGMLHLLVAEGKIRSVLIRRKGNVHGTRYYFMPSVLAYMHSLMDEQAQEKTKNLSGPAGSGSDCGLNQLDVDSSRLVKN